MRRIILLLVSLFALAATPAAAAGKPETWTVTQRSGDARVIRPGLQPASVTERQSLSPGDMIVTGASGRATLARGADYIVVAPRSQLRLPSIPRANGFTAIIQDLGTLLYKVRHTGKPHFEVDTPMLAAVVKGTTFTVVVGKDSSAVQVIEGAVEVTAMDGGARTLVEGGRAVFIDRGNPRALITADSVALSKETTKGDDTITIRGSASDTTLDVSVLAEGQVRVESVTAVAKPVGTVTTAVANPVMTTVETTRDVTGVVTTTTDVITTTPVTSIVTSPTLTAPTLETPTLATPTLATPTLTTPTLATPTLAAPTLSTPTIAIPTITEVSVPTVTAPTLTTPTVVVPTITAPTVVVPTVTVPTVTLPAVL